MSSGLRKRKRALNPHQSNTSPRQSQFHKYRLDSDATVLSRQDSLCQQCQTIDFFTVFITPITEKTGSFVSHIGTISSLSATCPFCIFLKQVASLSFINNDDDLTEYSLRAFSASSTIGHQISNTNVSFMPKLTPTSVLGLATAESSNSQGKQRIAQEVLKTWGYISPTSLPETVPQPYIAAHRVQPNEIDYTILKTWVEFCETNHRKTCTRLEDTEIPGLRLIDCETRTVVEEPDGQNRSRYAVLSYVWGLADKDPTKYKVCKKTKKLPDALPGVISDAMKVVLELGMRYLWADCYCIVQDDEDDVLKHMEVMDLIYNHAYITIVAAAGNDSSHGLPGVSIPKLEQPVVRIAGQTLVSTLPDPHEAISDSVWMTRGWTYQEALFSLRRLIFTPTQVYFECNNMHNVESVDLPLETLHTSDLRRFRTCLRHGMFRGGFGKRCWPLSTHIVNYSSRCLSFDSDILRGMLGIFRAFENSRVPIRNIMGVPVEFDLDLLNWKQQDRMRRQYFKDPWKIHASFARGLCWRLKESGIRREGFPSWSWSGWKGEVMEWPTFEALNKPEDPEIKFKFVAEGSIEMVDLGELYTQAPRGKAFAISHSSSLLDVEAWSFFISIISNPLQERHPLSFNSDFPSTFVAQVELVNGKSMYSNIFLSGQHATDNEEELCARKWRCLVLAYRKQASRSPVVVVVRDSGDTVERIGLVDFWVSWEMDARNKKVPEVFDDRMVQKERWKGQLR